MAGNFIWAWIIEAVKIPANAWVVKLVDTRDLKSCGHCGRAGSIPAPGTTGFAKDKVNVFFSGSK